MFISSKAMTEERLRPVGLYALKHISFSQVSMIYLWTALLHQNELITMEWWMLLALPLTQVVGLIIGRNFLDKSIDRQIGFVGFFKADFLGLYHHNLVKELPKLDKTLGIWNISQHRNEQDSMRESSTNDLFTRGKRCFVSKRKWTNDFFSAKMAASSAFLSVPSMLFQCTWLVTLQAAKRRRIVDRWRVTRWRMLYPRTFRMDICEWSRWQAW